VEVFALEGAMVTLRNVRTEALLAVGLTSLVCAARSVAAPVGAPVSAGVALAGLTDRQRREVQERAGHVREVLTGFRSGRAERPGPGEPDPCFAGEVPLQVHYARKAEQLEVGVRLAERRLLAEGLTGDSAVMAQTARRWTRLELPPFHVSDDAGRRQWRSLLKPPSVSSCSPRHTRACSPSWATTCSLAPPDASARSSP
jgi:hypothetical protein